jgi:hypothetical protein
LLLPVPPEHISARVALLGLESFRGFPSLVADIARSTTTLVDHSLPRVEVILLRFPPPSSAFLAEPRYLAWTAIQKHQA